MRTLYFVAHVPGRPHKAIRVFPPRPRHVRPSSGLPEVLPQLEETDVPRDQRGTGTPDCVAPRGRRQETGPAGVEAAQTEHVVPPVDDAPSEDDWIYDIEPPR